MSSYRRLTREKRYQILALKDTDLSIRRIAIVLGVAPSTISRELKRNSQRYDPEVANKAALKRRKEIGPRKIIVGELEEKIVRLLGLQWSPDQIAASLDRRISCESIYRFIYADHYLTSRKLYLNLRRSRRWRRSKRKFENMKNCVLRLAQVKISHRPKIVDERVRAGDFERDLMLGKNSRILVVVDRTSKLTKIAKLDKHAALETHRQTVRLLKGMTVHTITNDNGPEFSLHARTGEKLDAKVFFADPYCSWQRGTNENTNGLIRQYYPKGTDFNAVSAKDLRRIEALLNNRPRKCLGYQTPLEVHKRLSQGVALSA